MAMKSNRGHFAAAAMRLAKRRSGKLQTGAKDGMRGGGEIGGSKVPAKSGKMNTTKGQKALNPEQQ